MYIHCEVGRHAVPIESAKLLPTSKGSVWVCAICWDNAEMERTMDNMLSSYERMVRDEEDKIILGAD